MSQLVHIIYSSAATRPLTRAELIEMLTSARRKNRQLGITGMLLFSDGSFFQVLEGEPDPVNTLFSRITRDTRHTQITVIIREAIAHRSFGDWTMGYADIDPRELDTIVGTNDFFGAARSFSRLDQGRAKKLLAAFRHGRWRTCLSNRSPTPGKSGQEQTCPRETDGKPEPIARIDTGPGKVARADYSFAFQPIVNAKQATIFSYEALIRGPNQQPANQILEQVPPLEIHRFDEQTRSLAIELASRLGLTSRININFLPGSVHSSPATITSMLARAAQWGIRPHQIILEILEREIIQDVDRFSEAMNESRGSGLVFAIDDFGAGYAGLNLLAEFQPDLIKLDMHLMRRIDEKGPRQAIVRGILRTCLDLGIDVIAEGIETLGEYRWLRNEGIELFQGSLLAKPAFEELRTDFYLPPTA